MRQALSLIALRFRRTWLVMVVLSCLATALGAAWWHYDILELSDDERGAYDDGLKKFTGKPWFPWGAVQRADDLLIIAIDDKTFADVKAFEPWAQRYGTWPYDRVIWADVIQFLDEAGAKAVIFDTTMDEPRSDPVGDLAFGQTLSETTVPVFMGFNIAPRMPPLPPVQAVNPPFPRPVVAPPAVEDAGVDAAPETFPDDAQFPEDEAFPSEEVDAGAAAGVALERLARAYAYPVEARGGHAVPVLEKSVLRDDSGKAIGEAERTPVPSLEPLWDTTDGWGLVVMEEDEDGKMRRTRFAYSDGANTYVTLPVAAAADLLGAERIIIEPGALTLGTHVIPVDPDGAAWIDYGGHWADRYRTVSLVGVLRAMNRPAERALFKDKYVFVGGFALGTSDVKATPTESNVPGIIKQVAIFENLMRGRFITDAPYWASLLFTFFVCFFSVALVLVVRNVAVDVGWPVLLYAGFFVVTGSFLVLTKVHVLSAMPGFAGTLASVMATAWDRIFANRERERLKEMFRSYMEADLVDQMVEQRELPKLDGESMEVTAFFSDIRGFSTFSERFRDDPKGLLRLLNRYLSTCTPVLTNEGACIDKYIGDAVVALFGAPVRHGDHALRACRAALGVQQAIARLREDFKAEGLPDVYTRVGLNTDTMLVGNIGSEQLLDYTAIGDGMNLAARLEATNKQYGTLILMGENTFLATKGQVVAREVDMVRVAGKHNASRIYELVGLPGDVPQAKLDVLARYAEALTAYRARDFDEALRRADAVLALDPTDGPTLTLQARALAYRTAPPPEAWDGVAQLEK